MSKLIGSKDVNQEIRSAEASGQLVSPILTNYHFLSGLPDFRQYEIRRDDLFPLAVLLRTEPASSFSIIEWRRKKPLVPEWIAANLSTGHLEIIRETPRVRIMRYRKHPGDSLSEANRSEMLNKADWVQALTSAHTGN